MGADVLAGEAEYGLAHDVDYDANVESNLATLDVGDGSTIVISENGPTWVVFWYTSKSTNDSNPCPNWAEFRI